MKKIIKIFNVFGNLNRLNWSNLKILAFNRTLMVKFLVYLNFEKIFDDFLVIL